MRIKKRRTLLLSLISSFILLLNVFCIGIPSLVAQEPIKLKALSAWGPQQPYTQEFLIPLVDRLNKRSEGRLQVSWFGPESIPVFDQLKPLREGIFDLLYAHTSFHKGEVALGAAMDLFKGTPKERRDAGFYPILDEAYKKANAKVLGLNVLGAGYHFILKKELTKADFAGLKLRASPFYDPLIKTLGGVPIRVTPAETYSAIEKGVVDGAAWTVVGVLETKLYEVTKFLLRPQFGETVEILLVNINSWAKLPKDMQNLITQVTMEMEEEGYKNMKARYLKEEAELVRLGMKLNVLPPAEAEKFIKAYYEPSWSDLISNYSPDLGPKLKKITDEFIKKHKQ